ncbi:hypothetical protein Nepgr_008482 [Nepenthes gracilis]|uniref:Uncharacterized protein n=1 Tax=Nepenthes gracilis TaxID=150966 RepID=A0AAD3XJ99_NEPGR|nr:hypothetical protein Nepgr_008482 [Nepenthes gracilis]
MIYAPSILNSSTQCSILKTKDLLVMGSQCVGGDDRSISFWYDKWLGDTPLSHRAMAGISTEQFSLKLTDFTLSNGNWNWPLFENKLTQGDCFGIRSIHLSSPSYSHNEDIWHSNSGNYNVKKTYND